MSSTVYVLRRNSGSGGAEKAAERIACGLEKHFSVQRMWAGRRYLDKKIPGREGPPWWRSWRYSTFIDSLRLQQSNDLVLSLEYGPNCDIYRAGDGVHRRNVARRFGDSKRWMFNPWHWFAPHQERKCVTSARVIVANSKMVERELKAEYPEFTDKITTIYNGFNPEIYRTRVSAKSVLRTALDLPPEGTMLLIAGNGFERKGLVHALRILSELVHQRSCNAFLVVAGHGDTQQAHAMINDAGLGERVYVVGSVDNIEQYYQAANIMVLPTRNDPFSNACLEALACGCAVVTSDRNGAAEVITERNGFVMSSDFEEADITAAADFVIHHRQTPELIAKTVDHLTEACEATAYLLLAQQLLSSQADLSSQPSNLQQSM